MNPQYSKYEEITFSDHDVVNPDDYFMNVGCGDYKPYLIHDHGFTLAIVFALCEQDALDIAADEGRLDSFKIDEEELQKDYEPECKGVTFLGNTGEPYDIQTLGMIELPNPKFSFCAIFNKEME